MRHGWLAVLLVCAGCASAPISANPVQDVARVLPPLPAPLSLADGFTEAAFNLDNAVLVGALDATDPAPGCVHEAMVRLGLDPLAKPAPSFEPQTSTLLGKGAVAYIRARQAQRLSGSGVTVTTSCKALLGEILLDAAATGTRTLPGGGLLPVLR